MDDEYVHLLHIVIDLIKQTYFTQNNICDSSVYLSHTFNVSTQPTDQPLWQCSSCLITTSPHHFLFVPIWRHSLTHSLTHSISSRISTILQSRASLAQPVSLLSIVINSIFYLVYLVYFYVFPHFVIHRFISKIWRLDGYPSMEMLLHTNLPIYS